MSGREGGLKEPLLSFDLHTPAPYPEPRYERPSLRNLIAASNYLIGCGASDKGQRAVT